MTSLFANFTQGQATLAFRDVINHCESRRGSSGYTIENQTLKLKREISSRHFDVTELALRARLQERFPKGTRNIYGTPPSKIWIDSKKPLTHGYPLLYSRITVLIQYRPAFVYLNHPNHGRTSFDAFLPPNRPQYYLIASPWVLSYLISTASYRAYVNVVPDVAIGMATVISCVTRSSGWPKSSGWRGINFLWAGVGFRSIFLSGTLSISRAVYGVSLARRNHRNHNANLSK
jgi:hypothetical protein